MKYKLKYIYSLFVIITLMITNTTYAQYPGGVSTGTVRGYKVDYYNGTFSNQTQFGAGTTNAVPGNFGYSNKITGTEFYNIDNSYYALEYTGVLEITTAGNYSFQLTADDRAWLYIGDVLVTSATYTASSTVSVTLPIGNHAIKLKYYALGTPNSTSLRFTATPAGSGITAPTDVDGRFVHYDGAKLTAWYKAENLTFSAGNVTGFTNMAPDFSGNGNLTRSGAGSSQSTIATLINFNSGVRFDGDEVFSTTSAQKGLSYRGATKTMFWVGNYKTNTAQVNTWLFLHRDNNTNGTIGLFKVNSTTSAMGTNNFVKSIASAYTANEPKLLTGSVGQDLGGTAPSGTNPIVSNANGSTNTPSQITSNVTADANYGLRLATGSLGNQASGLDMSEAIYFPFKLSETEEKQVNTYLGIKYGITLQHDYLNTLGQPIFGLTTNAGYTYRIFGIGKEDAQGLNQKISQSQMVSTAGYDFLLASKGEIPSTDTFTFATNALNTGNVPNNSYLLFGDNNGAMEIQTNNLPTAFVASSTCLSNRLSRQWKVQATGTLGALNFRAGSSTVGSFKFPLSAAGLVMLVDQDGDGDFTTGSYTSFSASSLANGVATFENVTLNNGAVFTFAWSVISPGGVSNGLKLWTKADLEDFATGNVSSWTDLSPNFNHLTRSANANVAKQINQFNFNPAINFGGTDNQLLQSTSSLGMNGSNTFAEFYVLKGNWTSGLQWDEFITLGGGNHRWENTAVGAGARYHVYGNGTTGGASSTTGPLFNDLGLYSHTRNAVGAAVFRSNGEIRTTNATPGNLSLSGNFRIGTDVDATDGDGNFAGFWAPELIVYNTTLTDTEIRRVNSYLGIKYSIPMADGSGTTASDYLSADGTIIWSSNATHKFGMFGIGRDDCSGLNQKQSKAYFGSTDNIVIGKGTIATTNEANTNAFTANKNFVVIGHDNGAFTGIANNSTAYATISCNPYRYARTWKVKNTGSVTGLQMTIGNAANPIVSNWSNIALMIDADGDGDFTNATHIPASALNNGVATFNNVTLPDGAVFTLAYTLGFPGGVSKPSSGTPIAGATYVNGLEYKLYSTNGTAGSIAAGFGAYSPTLLSTGYYNNATSFHAFVTNKIATNFGIELTGKLYIPTTSATYRFSGTGDDQFTLIIDGSVLININGSPYTATTGDINLTAGYHDIIIRGREQSGSENFDLTWNGGSGGTYSAIPDVNFFVLPKGPSAWYMADDIALTASFSDGAIVTNWNDLGNGNNLNTYSGNPIYYNANKGFITNYNPSVYFTSDWLGTTNYLNGFAYGRQGKSIFAVGSNNNAGGETIYSAYGIDATNGNFGITKLTTGKLQLFGSSNTLTEAGTFYSTAAITTDIISGYHSNGNIAGVGINAYLYANGSEKASASKPAWNTLLNDNGQIYIGAAPDYANTYWYNKNINEIIYYPWDLSVVERQKVNSYLAIKWGTTLDQTSPTNYLASDGTTLWSAATAGSFKNDITVIGRDDCGALNQRQSTSTDGNDIIAIGNNTLVATNASNENAFTADKSFLAIAHNNATLTGITDANLPTSLTTGTTCYSRLNREWQAQVKGTVSNVSMEFGKTGAFTFTGSVYKPVLIIRNNTSTNYSLATIHQPTKVELGKAYFDNITFVNGDFFSIAYIQAAPGGVKENLTVWVDAGKDVYTDVAATTEALVQDDLVAYAKNQALNTSIANVEQATSGARPKLKLANINYNPGFEIDGTDDRLSSASVLSSTFRANNSITSFVAGLSTGGNTSTDFLWGHLSGAGSGTSMRKGQVHWANTASNRTTQMTGGQISSFSYTTGAGRMYNNAAADGTFTTGNATTGSANSFTIGSTSGANYIMGETIVYSDDKGVSTTDDMRKIASYLGVKYGFTQSAVGINNAYVASDMTPIYNYTTHWNRVTGIGRDDCSALEQKQAVSQNAGALVKISTDATNGLASNNSGNKVAITTDKTFLLFGDDNKSLTWTDIDAITVSSSSYVRLDRTWRVKETKTVAAVYLSVPGSTSGEASKLPAPSLGNTIFLMVSNTGDFSNNPTLVEMTADGDNWVVTYDFADGDYYTFGTLTTCFAPAGIASGLTSWYKMSNEPLGAASAINDNSGSGYTLSRVTAGAAVAAQNIASGTATLFNYNKYLPANGNIYYESAALSEASVYSVNAGTTFGVANGTAKDIFGFGRVSTPFNRTGLAGNDAYFNNVASAYPVSASQPNILVANTSAGGSSTTKNHVSWNNGVKGSLVSLTANDLPAAATYRLRFASITPGTATGPANTGVAEAFTYNRSLSDVEVQKVNTYLALKYGQTLPHNYFGPGYDGTNASTNTLYDISTYGNRVFGVGRHIAGCFIQNQSNSVQAESMLKISVDGAILVENSQNVTPWNEVDRAYVVMGDNAGALNWATINKPALYSTNNCLNRIGRQWKVTTTNLVPALFVTIPDNSSTAITKLDVVPVDNAVYMIINDNPDFTVNANQQEIPMVLNTTTKEWEAVNVTFDPNTTKYITFIYRPVLCGKPCLPVNPSTSRIRK